MKFRPDGHSALPLVLLAITLPALGPAAARANDHGCGNSTAPSATSHIVTSELLLRQMTAAGYADNEWRAQVTEARNPGRIDHYASVPRFGNRIVDRNVDWCGFFVAYNLHGAGMDRDLAAGFNHVNNVEAFFNYRHSGGSNRRRVPGWAREPGGEWMELNELHRLRGSERSWTAHDSITSSVDRGALDELEFRPGDVALIDLQGNGSADHIVMIRSWDPDTGILETVEGNSVGQVVSRIDSQGQPVTRRYPAGDERGTAVTVNRFDLRNRRDLRRLYGVGRPSLMDFRDLEYSADRPR